MPPEIRKDFISPSRGDVHVNRPLTNISVAYMQDAMAFASSRTFPVVPVEKRSDHYFVFPLGEFYRDEMKERAPSTESQGGGYALSHDTYLARRFALHKDIDDEVRANQDMPLNEDMQATNWLTSQAMINRERRWNDSYFKAGVWRLEADGVASSATARGSLNLVRGSSGHDANNNILQWNDANSNPIEDVRLVKQIMLSRTGFEPNKLTLGKQVYDVLLDHPDVIARLDRGQTNGPAIANIDALAALFELDEIVVSKAVWNSARMGEDPVINFIAGNHALLSYSPAAPALMTPSCGYTYAWNGFMGASAFGTRMKRLRMEAITSDRVEIESYYDYKVVADELGAFLNGIVAGRTNS